MSFIFSRQRSFSYHFISTFLFGLIDERTIFYFIIRYRLFLSHVFFSNVIQSFTILSIDLWMVISFHFEGWNFFLMKSKNISWFSCSISKALNIFLQLAQKILLFSFNSNQKTATRGDESNFWDVAPTTAFRDVTQLRIFTLLSIPSFAVSLAKLTPDNQEVEKRRKKSSVCPLFRV